jgi:DNA-binding winged helix-turn-helix (wHTH) protein/TolB-like protein
VGNFANEVRFDAFALDLSSGELRRDGEPVRLQEQPFRLLAFLLEHAGDVVTREDLRRALWPDDFVDFEHGLNTAVRKLRAALDDSAEHPRFIETLARRGYRFIAPVSTERADETSAPRWWIVGVAAVLIVAIAFAFLRPSRKIGDLAVLPFVNSDAKTWHVSDGLTDILTDRLSRLPNLRVLARGTVFDLRAKKLGPAAAGKALGVSTVVTGQWRTEGDTFRIHVELIDVRDGAQLWGQSYSATASELPMMQDRIASDLARRLRGGTPAKFASTQDPAANEQYLLGLQAWNRRGKSDVLRSIEFFQRATELDPNFAAAYAGLANAWGVLAGNEHIDPREGALNVLSYARKALELDPDNAEAYNSIATTEYRAMFDFAAAERDYKRSLALNPNYATAHQWYSEFLRESGRIDEAHREIELARRLDPLSKAVNATACFGLIYEARYPEAIALAKKSEQLGRPLTLCAMRAAFDANVTKPLIESRLASLKAEPDAELTNPVEIAESYAMLFHLMPGFDALRDDPRFTAVARRVGLPEAGLAFARDVAAKRRHQ